MTRMGGGEGGLGMSKIIIGTVLQASCARC